MSALDHASTLAGLLERAIPVLQCLHASNTDELANEARTAVDAYNASAPNPARAPRVLVTLEGGLVQGVLCETPTDFVVIDYDDEGADEDELTAIPQDDDSEADAIARIEPGLIDPAFIARAYAAIQASDAADSEGYALWEAEVAAGTTKRGFLEWAENATPEEVPPRFE